MESMECPGQTYKGVITVFYFNADRKDIIRFL